ncbi:hypothetical protein [Nostoc sp.]|uniref:hypothetical protein n=1 Tax=Nostoc sp. TaxID=1180 RepID=UPI002FF7A73E
MLKIRCKEKELTAFIIKVFLPDVEVAGLSMYDTFFIGDIEYEIISWIKMQTGGCWLELHPLGLHPSSWSKRIDDDPS